MKIKKKLIEQIKQENEHFFDGLIDAGIASDLIINNGVNSKNRLEVYNAGDPLFGGYDYDFFFDGDHTKPRSALIKSYYHPGLYDGKILLSENHQKELQSKYTLNREMEVSISIGITNEKGDTIGLAQTIIQ